MIYVGVHVISLKKLKLFWAKHPEASGPLRAWYTLTKKIDLHSFDSVRKIFRSADYSAPYTIFDIGGNKFRIITIIHYNRKKVYVREVFTHVEYDRWNKARK
jgi:mRNA interferase HigB